MKKLLCGFVCAAAGAALAVESPVVTTVDVVAIDSGLKNTVVAIPGLDLSGGDLVVSNLVKTTNLSVGDTLYAFGEDGKYDSWTLNESKHWEHAEKKYIITAKGPQLVEASPASAVTLPVGSGIWLSRKVYATENPFYVYASHVGEPSTTVAARATKLVGNPKLFAASPIIANPTVGDKINKPNSGQGAWYEYKSDGWKYRTGFAEVSGLPTIPAGTGFWYVSATNASDDVTITWLAVQP